MRLRGARFAALRADARLFFLYYSVLVGLFGIGETIRDWWDFSALVRLFEIGETFRHWWDFSGLVGLFGIGETIRAW